MSLANTHLASIKHEHLARLLADRVEEGVHLDFKRDLYAASDEQKAEFLADISAFANAAGGDIIVGIDEEKGAASTLRGLDPALDLDKEVLRLQQVADSGLEPRIPGLAFHVVRGPSGEGFLIIRVPASPRPPHRVVHNGRFKNRFFIRGSKNKREPDMGELRALFNVAPQRAARVQAFREERLACIAAGETPQALQPKPGVAVLHLLPFTALDASETSFALHMAYNTPWNWIPCGEALDKFAHNHDGFVTWSAKDERGRVRAYTQVFQTGALEAVAVDIVRKDTKRPVVFLQELENKLLTAIARGVDGLREHGVSSPIAVSLSLMGVQGTHFVVNEPQFNRDWPTSVSQDRLVFEVTVPADVRGSPAVEEAVQPMCDWLHRTGGRPGSPSFNSSGRYRPR
jgi:hypothetical protein